VPRQPQLGWRGIVCAVVVDVAAPPFPERCGGARWRCLAGGGKRRRAWRWLIV